MGGDSMSGELNMANHKIKNLPTPTDNGDACNKEYVETKLDHYINADGDSMGGELNMVNHKIKKLTNSY